MSLSDKSPLPYQDTKPVGAADFYYAINASFRFIHGRFGLDGLRRYWTDLGQTYMRPVSDRWKTDGLDGVAAYWRAFFKAEPGAEVQVQQAGPHVTMDVKTCPAIAQLRKGGREILPCFCQHCYFISEAAASSAGLTVRVEGGNGACRQTFYPQAAAPLPQDPEKIAEVSPC